MLLKCIRPVPRVLDRITARIAAVNKTRLYINDLLATGLCCIQFASGCFRGEEYMSPPACSPSAPAVSRNHGSWGRSADASCTSWVSRWGPGLYGSMVHGLGLCHRCQAAVTLIRALHS